MEFKNRYDRNMMTILPEEHLRLKDFRVCVVGCGGLGGYVIEGLGRIGLGHITAIDGDVFDESNLNRQLLCEESLVGNSKAKTAVNRMANVNSEVTVKAVTEFLTAENANTLIAGHDLVIDALDNMFARLLLEQACTEEKIPLVHGAIGGWYGQVTVILPGRKVFEKIYPGDDNRGVEVVLGNPSFTPMMVAAIEVSEAIKLLLGREDLLVGKLLTIDLLSHTYDIFHL